MLHFESDYLAGAHPAVLDALIKANGEKLPGYGADAYTESAKRKISEACGNGVRPEDIAFLTGGTQTNSVVISTMLRDWQGVIAPTTGHVSVHEAGAIEYSGSKVITLGQFGGKIPAPALRQYLAGFFADPNHEHMVFPGMVYISHPTEYGTLYSLSELTEISGVCRKYGIPLFIDGARLAYALACGESDVTLGDITRLSDVFYIGGTKVGALCGEAVVFTKRNMPEHFMTSVKKRGALLAKGALLGVQFDALFTDGLYFEIGRHTLDMAAKIKNVFSSRGFDFLTDSPTNQQFVILGDDLAEKLSESVGFEVWEKTDADHTAVRFAAGWYTDEDDISGLASELDKAAEMLRHNS